MKQKQMVTWVLASALLLLGPSSWAAEWKEFDQKAFEAAQAQDKTVVLDFHADWCTTCQKQKPILESLVKEPKYDSVAAFKVDFDKAGDIKKHLKVQKQSTLIVFKGKKEVDRQMGLTDRDKIESLIAKGL